MCGRHREGGPASATTLVQTARSSIRRHTPFTGGPGQKREGPGRDLDGWSPAGGRQCRSSLLVADRGRLEEQIFSLGSNREGFAAELYAIYRAMRTFETK